MHGGAGKPAIGPGHRGASPAAIVGIARSQNQGRSSLSRSDGNKAELRAIKVDSKVGEGESLLQEKNYQRAFDYFRRMASGTDMELAAAGKAATTAGVQCRPEEAMPAARQHVTAAWSERPRCH